ncbi:hypothetical protein BB561_006591 [Smittium simulii]|uniref:Aspartic peptidase DDI1-type domain-containing protein n=1 Tax=Smittium simulii TaxID=133385 RepID=A0A2T9Y2X8_9FUNG|nr:hypothetical protein BB561_006591 [Smittium simulii]
MLNSKQMRTPEKAAGQARKLPFSTGSYAPEKKKIYEPSTPTRRMKQESINLVEIPGQQESEVAAIVGEATIQGQPAIFQYDSGAAVSVISRKLVERLKLQGEQPAYIKLKPVIGDSTASNVLNAVKVKLKGCIKSISLYILENHEQKLLLLGISTLMNLGAEISLRDALMTIEDGSHTYEIPLTFRTREPCTEQNIYEIQTQRTGVGSPSKKRNLNLLSKFQSTFASKLEDLREAIVQPCEKKLLKDEVIKQRPYRLARNLQEEVMEQLKEIEKQGVSVATSFLLAAGGGGKDIPNGLSKTKGFSTSSSSKIF